MTGSIPVQIEQGNLVSANLRWVEIGSAAAVVVIVALAVRSLVAPVVVLATAGVAYLITLPVVDAAAGALGFSAPAQLRPVVVALTLGLTADYAILFLSGMRQRLREGSPDRQAARSAVEQYLPIVLVAGVTVAAVVATLLVAEFGLFRASDPAWRSPCSSLSRWRSRWCRPCWPSWAAGRSGRAGWPGGGHAGGETVGDTGDDSARRPQPRVRLARALTRRPVAGAVVVVSLALLLAASWPLLGLRASVLSPETLPPREPGAGGGGGEGGLLGWASSPRRRSSSRRPA